MPLLNHDLMADACEYVIKVLDAKTPGEISRHFLRARIDHVKGRHPVVRDDDDPLRVPQFEFAFRYTRRFSNGRISRNASGIIAISILAVT